MWQFAKLFILVRFQEGPLTQNHIIMMKPLKIQSRDLDEIRKDFKNLPEILEKDEREFSHIYQNGKHYYIQN